MEIFKNKQITTLIYKNYITSGIKISTLTNGEILDVSDLISPFRGEDINLTKHEPHISFYDGTVASFIPMDDIINIKYG